MPEVVKHRTGFKSSLAFVIALLLIGSWNFVGPNIRGAIPSASDNQKRPVGPSLSSSAIIDQNHANLQSEGSQAEPSVYYRSSPSTRGSALPGFAIVALVIVFVIFNFIASAKEKERVQSAGRKLGLRWRQGNAPVLWTLSGDYKGVPVEIEARRERRERSMHDSDSKVRRREEFREQTIIEVRQTGTFDTSFCLSREGFLDRIGRKILGLQDLQIGDSELDPLLVIKGKDRKELARILRSPRVKKALLRLFDKVADVAIDEQSLRFETPGIISREDRLESLVANMVAVARAFDAADGHDNDEPG